MGERTEADIIELLLKIIGRLELIEASLAVIIREGIRVKTN